MNSADNILVNTGEINSLGEAQWACIKMIEKQFINKVIKGSSSLFSDDRWVCDSRENPTIKWDMFDDFENRTALLLLLKIGAYYQIEFKQNAIQTVKGYLIGLKSLLGKTFIDKNILYGKEGEFLIGIDVLDVEDIVNAIDSKIMSGRSVDGNKIGSINIIKDIPPTLLNNFSLFNIKFVNPWAGQFDEWLANRHSVLQIPLFESQPYVAMPSTTAQKLIECSMRMIENCSSETVEIFKKYITEDSSNSRKYQNNDLNEVISQFPQLKTELNRLYGNNLNWSRFFHYVILLKAACINIILLTSGLRNMDIRHLKIGCCKPSGKIDILNYLEVDISKTKIHELIPVPNQTRICIEVLEKLRYDNSDDRLISSSMYKTSLHIGITGGTLNRWIYAFARHHNIPFHLKKGDSEFTAHCYRATVASWIDASSNLAILLIRRLFAHKNSLMPLAYLHHNPNFVNARKKSLEQSAERMAFLMAAGAEQHRLTGKRGEELINGFDTHKLKFQSETISDKALFTSFQDRIKERIVNGSMFAMMTPFGVICTRNPNNSTPTPCAKISDKNKINESGIDQEIWNYLQATPNPSQCIGKACEHAMLGPWSTALKDSFKWYVDLLEGRIGRIVSNEELRSEAKSFVRQYASDMKAIFEINTNHA